MRKSNFVINIASFCLIMSVLLVLAGCSSNPSETDAKAILEKNLNELAKRPENKGVEIKLKSFKKTNGLPQEANGVKFYTLSYEAEFECSNDIIKYDELSGIKTPKYKRGLNQKKGEITFKKSEKGWAQEGIFY